MGIDSQRALTRGRNRPLGGQGSGGKGGRKENGGKENSRLSVVGSEAMEGQAGKGRDGAGLVLLPCCCFSVPSIGVRREYQSNLSSIDPPACGYPIVCNGRATGRRTGFRAARPGHPVGTPSPWCTRFSLPEPPAVYSSDLVRPSHFVSSLSPQDESCGRCLVGAFPCGDMRDSEQQWLQSRHPAPRTNAAAARLSIAPAGRNPCR